MDTIKLLYHGTCPQHARILLAQGWKPNQISPAGNQGQARYLYLTTGYENALWFAEQKGCDVVLEVHDVPRVYLAVDPEDGVGPDIDAELNLVLGLPGNLVLTKPLAKEHFRLSTGR